MGRVFDSLNMESRRICIAPSLFGRGLWRILRNIGFGMSSRCQRRPPTWNRRALVGPLRITSRGSRIYTAGAVAEAAAAFARSPATRGEGRTFIIICTMPAAIPIATAPFQARSYEPIAL